MQFALTGMYLDREPIAFEEGGMPCFQAWQQWLHCRRRRLTLLLEAADEMSLDHIDVTITLERPKTLGKTGHPR